MNIAITFKHLKHTPAVDKKIREKIAALSKYLEGYARVRWVCSYEEFLLQGIYVTEIQVFGPTFNFHSMAKSANLYKSFDAAFLKMEKQLIRHKEKWKNKLHARQHEMEIMDPENAWLAAEEET